VRREFYSHLENEEQFRPLGGFMSGDQNSTLELYEMKNLLLAFTLLGASIAGAKTYNITLSSPAAIGNSQLERGEYKLELKGDSVLVKDGKKVSEFPVHVENEARKFENTSITTSSQSGSNRIEEIRLGGTTVKLVFSN
jgi:hypothetical protein